MAYNGRAPRLPQASIETILEGVIKNLDRKIDERIAASPVAVAINDLAKGGFLNAGMLSGSIPAREVVHNATGSSIAAMRACYVSGDTAGVTNVALARANADATMPAVGITSAAIANGENGVLVKVGRIDGLDTSAFAVNALLYVSSATAGILTDTAPASRVQPVALVAKAHASTGAILVLCGADSRRIAADHDHTIAGDGGILSGDIHDSYSEWIESSAPTTPAANATRVHALDVGGTTILEQLNDSGLLIRHGTELYLVARNITGSSIATGKAVYISGVNSGFPTIALAKADAIATVRSYIGTTAQAIANSSNGLVTVQGLCTAGYDVGIAGEEMYVSDSVAGGLTRVPPALPVQAGIGLNVSSSGAVVIQPGGRPIPPHRHDAEGAGDAFIYPDRIGTTTFVTLNLGGASGTISNLAGLSATGVVAVLTNAGGVINLTGLNAPPTPSMVLLVNDSGFLVNLKYNTTSTVGNRFTTNTLADYFLGVGDSVWIFHGTWGGTASWRVIGTDPRNHSHAADDSQGGGLLLPRRLGTVPIVVSTLTGTVNNWNPGAAIATDGLVVRVTGSGAWIVTGIVAPTGNKDVWLHVYNESGFTGQINHQDAGSSAGNRITTYAADNITVPARSGLSLFYNSTLNEWVVELFGFKRHIHSNDDGGGMLDNSSIITNAEIAVAKLADGDALALLRTASDGATVEWGSAGQIVFPATQNASANANTLDDYEEGTGTITLLATTTSGTHTYVTQTYHYTKIGRQVAIHGNVSLATKGGTIAGTIFLGNLPFTGDASNTEGISAAYFGAVNLDAGYTFLGFLIQGAALFPTESGDNVGHSFMAAATVNANTIWSFTGVYYQA